MKIIRSALLIFVAVVLALGTVPFWNGRAWAAPSPDPTDDLIWCGLWTGANLYIPSEQAAAYNCQKAQASASAPSNQNSPSAPQQANTPPQTGSTTSNSNNNGRSHTYAALGDSVAAGLGLPGIAGGSQQDVQCGRSSQAYPYIVATSLGRNLLDQACTGATAGDLVTQQRMSGPNPAAQLDVAFAQGTPGLITITAGANDAQWAAFIRSCYSGTCNTQSRTRAVNAALVVLQTKLYYALSSIQARSNGGQPPQVIVTGYYNPVSASCAGVQQQITPAELAWISAGTNALNQTVRNVTAQFRYARFAPVDFTGHDICSDNPWVQGLDDKAPFHPTATGQQAIANSVLRAVGR